MKESFAGPKKKGYLAGLFGLGIFVAIFLAMHWPTDSPVLVSGVVESIGAVSVAKIKGGTREAATIRLVNGKVVVASVVTAFPLFPGDKVTVIKQARILGGPVYQVVARDSEQ